MRVLGTKFNAVFGRKKTRDLFDMDFVIIDRLMSGYGTAALAAVGIVLKAERLPLNIGGGICQGMVPIISYNHAAGNKERSFALRRAFLLSGICCAVVSIVLYEIFAPQILRFFIADAETVALGTGFLRRRALATILMFISFFHVYLFNAYGKGGTAFFLGATRWLGFNIPMLFVMNRLMGMYGIVWAQLIADTLTVILSLCVHRRFEKMNARKP